MYRCVPVWLETPKRISGRIASLNDNYIYVHFTNLVFIKLLQICNISLNGGINLLSEVKCCSQAINEWPSTGAREILNSNHTIRYSDKYSISLQSQGLCVLGMSIYKQHSGINAEAVLK